MSPVEKAAAVYQREPCAHTFREDLEAHLVCGYVHSTPEAFAMVRPVCSSADDALILDPWHRFARDEQDAWLIWLGAGDIGPLLALLPYHLPRLGWQKRNRLRWYDAGSSQQHLLVRLGKVGHSPKV